MILFYILISTFLVSLLAFVGVVILFLREKLLDKILLFLVAFSAGALMGSAFFHLIPEAIEKMPQGRLMPLFLYLMAGFCAFFVLEHFIKWHHHHTSHCTDDCPEVKTFSYLILIGDAIHNFIDGLVIAASFVIAVPVGLATTVAVALHEIPQEIGDFGVLVYGGFKRASALFVNFLSALLAIFGGIIGFLISEEIGGSIVFLLPFTAGSFLYIACADLIPQIKKRVRLGQSFFHFAAFLSGLSAMLLLKVI